MSIANALLAELEQEAQTTQRVLERVPQAHLSWKPHREVDVARAAGAARRDGARQRRRAGLHGHRSRAAGVRAAGSRHAPPSSCRRSTASVAKARQHLGGVDDATMARRGG